MHRSGSGVDGANRGRRHRWASVPKGSLVKATAAEAALNVAARPRTSRECKNMGNIKNLPEVPAKTMATIKTQANKMVAAAQAVEVKTKDDELKALDLGANIKRFAAIIKAEKEKITKPLLEALTNARRFFAPFEAQCTEAEEVIKEKLGVFHQKQMAEAAKKAAVVEKSVEQGKMKFETAEKKLAGLELKKTVGAEGGPAVQYKTVRDVEVFDEVALPRAYLVPNAKKIKEDVLAGKEVPGARLVEKQEVALRKATAV